MKLQMSDAIQSLTDETEVVQRQPYLPPVLIDLSISEKTAAGGSVGDDGAGTFTGS